MRIFIAFSNEIDVLYPLNCDSLSTKTHFVSARLFSVKYNLHETHFNAIFRTWSPIVDLIEKISPADFHINWILRRVHVSNLVAG